MTFDEEVDEIMAKFEGVWCPKFMDRLDEVLPTSNLKLRLDKAKANGLTPLQVPMYIEAFILSTDTENDIGIATMMVPGIDWQSYLQRLIDELLPKSPYDNRTMSKPKPKIASATGDKEKKPMNTKAKTQDLPQGEEGVPAAEGDKYRREIRKLAEELGYDLTETGGAVTCKDGDDVIAICAYKRGTKNGAWKDVHEQLSVLL